MDVNFNRKAIVFSAVGNKQSDFSIYLLKFSVYSEHFSKYSLREDLQRSISHHSAAIFLIDRKDDSLLYYLGMCDALGVRSLIFIGQDLPPNPILSSRLFCYVDFADPLWYEKAAVNIYISQLLREPAPQSIDRPDVKGSLERAYYLNNTNGRRLLERTKDSKSEVELEQILSIILSDSGIIFSSNKRLTSKKSNLSLRPDFIIWSLELEHIIGNPIILEVRNRRFREEDVDQMGDYISHFESAAGVILYRNFTEEDRKKFDSTKLSSNIGAHDLLQFIETYLAMDFKNAVLRCFS